MKDLSELLFTKSFDHVMGRDVAQQLLTASRSLTQDYFQMAGLQTRASEAETLSSFGIEKVMQREATNMLRIARNTESYDQSSLVEKMVSASSLHTVLDSPSLTATMFRNEAIASQQNISQILTQPKFFSPLVDVSPFIAQQSPLTYAVPGYVVYEPPYVIFSELENLDWTFPGNDEWSMTDVIELSRSTGEMDADEFMIAWYANNDADLSALQGRLTSDGRLGSYRVLIEQCFVNIRAGHFAIVQPAMYTILEKVVRRLAAPEHQRSVQIAKVFKAIERNNGHNLEYLSAKSLAVFVERRYRHYNFQEETEPVFGQRHALMHGFKPPRNEYVECLKLIHAVETALSLNKDEAGYFTFALPN